PRPERRLALPPCTTPFRSVSFPPAEGWTPPARSTAPPAGPRDSPGPSPRHSSGRQPLGRGASPPWSAAARSPASLTLPPTAAFWHRTTTPPYSSHLPSAPP